jgi:DNA replication initiation complex subunit (GINS family)
MVRYTRSIVEEYKEIRKRAKKICRKKKREHEKRKLETLEEYGAKGEIRKLYKEIRQRKIIFQPVVDFCRDKEGNLVGGEV